MSYDKINAAPLMREIKTLEFIIENKAFRSEVQYKTGLELKQLAGIPPDTDLYLSIECPWEDELITNGARVDLARPTIEYFYVRKKLSFSINGQPFIWYKQYITGKEIRELGKIDAEDDIFLKIRKPFEDELITDATKVDLARPGVEHFVSIEKPVDVILIINGKEKPWQKKKITFSELVTLAFGTYTDNDTTVYTVTYKRGPNQNPEGSMVKGDSVHIKNKMVFNVTATDKS
ncbi:multiubiquitin domain-containing protein [Runella slithyformis]|uniref:Multi-ubiquitin domain-containing protein n=1 Tax=Runella slithyformis (strain ATCC 29530 / DSM 19594 / LMG 11500 / NCIMB 11436 / LSU 4) TaxID=761193 RepID=A0A7U3ZRR7_RUNSL|nr:multiubiquitin domain-containing protein [Runella slithyformis]AEI52165.1 hypothetical protein Runsl_5869 [Runella slithyformis DSM 19594]